jgi:hypothetical protein
MCRQFLFSPLLHYGRVELSFLRPWTKSRFQFGGRGCRRLVSTTPPPPVLPPSHGHNKQYRDVAAAAVLVNIGVSCVSLTALTLCVLDGVDMSAALKAIEPWVGAVQFDPLLGHGVLIFTIHTLIGPIRYMLVGALVPFFLPWYRRIIKPPVLALMERAHNLYRRITTKP